ncbi:disease resistance protein RPV1-like isoform X1 [Eucalyptus grandis]|uniref:disease resistance protein RPV1-like isoform X1 n=1 Tax=Eucalyptus grandis TaxID=71139 RepID=UPI00192F077B|nr:disease resistance protein RPV1-like isoform X1 [Eucalyptus grandis]
MDSGMKSIQQVLCNKRVLIVLDDVDNKEQVEKLVGNSALLSASRILITTRNKDVLQTNGPKYQILEYGVEVMTIDHALELFSRHAFNRNFPSGDYKDLSKEIVFTTGRLPLALEVIGSFLYHKPQEIWQETLDKLSKAPHEDVFGKLKISYDALSFEQQQIFLDIACFFIGEDKTNAMYMWNDCDFLPNTGVVVLISMSLVKIVENNKFWMHDQLRDLGRRIVYLENRMNLKGRSRIWNQKEAFDATRTKEISKKVQALNLDISTRSSQDVVVQSKEIGRFKHLRFLKLSSLTLVGDTMNHLAKVSWISLRSIYKWTNMYLNKVVVLELSAVEFLDDSRLQDLIKMASQLKVLSLEKCGNLTRTPDFSECLNLERLTFRSCFELREIDSSIGKLKCLINLKIEHCSSLEHLLEEIGDLVKLQYFFVEDTKVNKLPDSIWKLKSLREVCFRGRWIQYSGNLWGLPSASGLLEKLEVLKISDCDLKDLPSTIGNLHSLRILDLSFTHISEIPKTISMLTRLQRIKLLYCFEIRELPTLPTSLTHLFVSSSSLRVVPDLSNLTNLVELHLFKWGNVGDKPCTGGLWWIGRLSKLTFLSVGLEKVSIPWGTASLPLLKHLDIYRLDKQNFLPFSFSTQRLGLDNFNSAASLSPGLRDLTFLFLGDSRMQEFQLDGLQLPQLKELRVHSWALLKRLRLSRMRKLREVMVSWCPKLVEIQLSWVFESLEALSIDDCVSLERLVYETANELISCEGKLIFPSRVLNKLRALTLRKCFKILNIQVVGTSESWEKINLDCCCCLQSLGGLANIKNLKSLDICNCNSLRVVEGVDELEFLGQLNVCYCRSLERLIDVSTTKLPSDCSICIDDCKKLRGVRNPFSGPVMNLGLPSDAISIRNPASPPPTLPPSPPTTTVAVGTQPPPLSPRRGKEAQRVAKRKRRRGPRSVISSSAVGCVCSSSSPNHHRRREEERKLKRLRRRGKEEGGWKCDWFQCSRLCPQLVFADIRRRWA